MQKYKEFSPTQFDTKGLCLDGHQDWLVVPVGRNRDSGCLARSNFRVALSILKACAEDDYELHRFGHWGPGWFEIIIVRPGSKAQKEAESIEASLADYPVLSDEDYSELESEEKCADWEHMSLSERVELCQEAGASVMAARHDAIPDKVFDLIEVP